ncbi:hypothetical protein DPMN_109540 [Dreissena polymorpha]|uniref:Uncharacterized protein n=1 Tax=Dreissena polymorpha TaxID=45954 RepID=A0A9D4KAX7_DREPO|nr:hypothetical protein DPMN_109540 [Dreissena polymorpha]
MTPVADFGPKWNTVVTYMEKGQRREIDRRSWITMDNQPLRYVLDSLSLPQYVKHPLCIGALLWENLA